jgi:hypothetical protein
MLNPHDVHAKKMSNLITGKSGGRTGERASEQNQKRQRIQAA